MPDLDYRFDKYTEEYQSEELERIRLFARESPPSGPVSLEIGTNRGRFLKAIARRHPDRYFLGVEWTPSLAETAKKRLERASVDNADVLAADAKHVLPVVIDDGQLRELFLLYPDPWWKTRHRKRRVIQPEFLDLLAEKMCSRAPLWIRTDVGPFADDMRQLLDEHRAFEPMDIFEIPIEPLPRSTRERHVVESGIPVHLVYYVRR
ncbi:MAG: tRNA (guanosine(46)-N7)-methyltransferase TrmB [Persicimonas sp.]